LIGQRKFDLPFERIDSRDENANLIAHCESPS